MTEPNEREELLRANVIALVARPLEATAKKYACTFTLVDVAADLRYACWRLVDPLGRRAVFHYIQGDKISLQVERAANWPFYEEFNNSLRQKFQEEFARFNLPNPRFGPVTADVSPPSKPTKTRRDRPKRAITQLKWEIEWRRIEPLFRRGDDIKDIADELKIHRDTVSQIIQWAAGKGKIPRK